jgi:hypothetical protein
MQNYYRSYKDGTDPMGQILPISYNIKKKTANMSDNEQFIELVEKHTEDKE